MECVGCADRSAYDLTKHSEKTKERLVAREILTEPRIVEKTVVIINKKLFGPTFKKDAKIVETYLTGLSDAQSMELDAKLQKEGYVSRRRTYFYPRSKASVVCEDGKSYEVTKDLVSFSHVTEKIHGKRIGNVDEK